MPATLWTRGAGLGRRAPGGGFRFVYRLLGYRDRWAYARESYRDLFRRLELPVETCTVAEGRIPAGLAVLRRPRPSSLEVLL